jgi:hypothetical protein
MAAMTVIMVEVDMRVEMLLGEREAGVYMR